MFRNSTLISIWALVLASAAMGQVVMNEQFKLTASDGVYEDLFGTVSIDAGFAIVGAFGDNNNTCVDK